MAVTVNLLACQGTRGTRAADGGALHPAQPAVVGADRGGQGLDGGGQGLDGGGQGLRSVAVHPCGVTGSIHWSQLTGWRRVPGQPRSASAADAPERSGHAQRGARPALCRDLRGGRRGGAGAAAALSPRLRAHVYDYIAGDLYADPALPVRTRELVVIATLAAQGGMAEQLAVHLQVALDNGATVAEIIGTLETVGTYAGVPRALNALFTAAEVFARRGLAATEPAESSRP